MVVTSRNHQKIHSLAHNINNSRVFLAVRCLVADEWLDSWDEARLRYLFNTVASIDASLHLVQLLSSSATFRPHRLAVRYGRLAELPEALPTPTLTHITHLTGYVPNREQDVNVLAEGMPYLLDAMPALTHVVLEVLSLSRCDSEDDSDSDADGAAVYSPLDLVALERTLRATLRHHRIHAVALRVAAEWLPQWPAVVHIAARLKDTRLYAWLDTRPIKSWTREKQLAEEDAWTGRSIWSEAQQIWRPDE